MSNPRIGDERVSVILPRHVMRALRRHQADLAAYGRRPPIAELCRNAVAAYYAPDEDTP